MGCCDFKTLQFTFSMPMLANFEPHIKATFKAEEMKAQIGRYGYKNKWNLAF